MSVLPGPSDLTLRLCRGVLLRHLAADLISADALNSFHLLASLPSLSPTLAAAHLAVTTFLTASTPDFDAAARVLFARPGSCVRYTIEEGGSPALASNWSSNKAVAIVNQFEATIGNSFYRAEGVVR
jgi:telomeric repeat-binding factor 2